MVIILVILLALVIGRCFLWDAFEKKAQTVVIYQNGKKVRELPLQTEEEMWIRGEYTNHVVIKDGAVAIAESDCPGADCVHSGEISQAGRNIVCLPNRVEIRIEGEKEVDFILY